jgi:hypothetical protein
MSGSMGLPVVVGSDLSRPYPRWFGYHGGSRSAPLGSPADRRDAMAETATTPVTAAVCLGARW